MRISGFILFWILLSCAVSPFVGIFLARNVRSISQGTGGWDSVSGLARKEPRTLPARMGIRALPMQRAIPEAQHPVQDRVRAGQAALEPDPLQRKNNGAPKKSAPFGCNFRYKVLNGLSEEESHMSNTLTVKEFLYPVDMS